MKSITLSADEALLEAARRRAEAERTTLNAEFRRWLEGYAGRAGQAAAYDDLMRAVAPRISTAGRRFSRDERNER